MTTRLREQNRLRDAAWKAYVDAKADASFEVYRKQRNKVGHVQRKARMAYETNLATSAAVNLKKLFGHIRQNKRLKNQIVKISISKSVRLTSKKQYLKYDQPESQGFRQWLDFQEVLV